MKRDEDEKVGCEDDWEVEEELRAALGAALGMTVEMFNCEIEARLTKVRDAVAAAWSLEPNDVGLDVRVLRQEDVHAEEWWTFFAFADQHSYDDNMTDRKKTRLRLKAYGDTVEKLVRNAREMFPRR